MPFILGAIGLAAAGFGVKQVGDAANNTANAAMKLTAVGIVVTVGYLWWKHK